MNLTSKDFSYHLPPSQIAHQPASPRDHSRILLIRRSTGGITHHHFFDLPDLLPPRAVLVTNESRVFSSRVHAHKISRGKVELLFLNPTRATYWAALLKPGLPSGTRLLLGKLELTVVRNNAGIFTIDTHTNKKVFFSLLNRLGLVPIPPYIHGSQNQSQLKRQYQTIYAKTTGSVAAPTAGLHFTHRLIKTLKARDIDIHSVTLHVGLGTFRPPSPQQLESGVLHEESIFISPKTAAALNLAKAAGRPIIAVGTTATRVLESSLSPDGLLLPTRGSTSLFIKPPYRFRFIDGLITNFHLPESSLLMLISAFCSSPNTRDKFTDFRHSLVYRAYSQAIQANYRFYSFGDATLLL